MIEIKDLLLRFDNILISQEVQKNTIASVLNEIISLKIKPENIQIKKNIIYLDIKPIYKNEIFFKKDLIFAELEKKLGKKKPLKII